MPPRAVWKIRPSGVVPYRLMWARSSRTSSGGIGIVALLLCQEQRQQASDDGEDDHGAAGPVEPVDRLADGEPTAPRSIPGC
jgi:hypothetical protein